MLLIGGFVPLAAHNYLESQLHCPAYLVSERVPLMTHPNINRNWTYLPVMPRHGTLWIKVCQNSLKCRPKANLNSVPLYDR